MGIKNGKKITFRITPAYITKTALLSALSFILYMFCKFKLPFFPSFLDMQFSEFPAILAGFSMGPVSGCAVIVIKCLLKLPFSTTGYVGELTDILLGISYVLPSALIYKRNKTRKNALISLAVGTAVGTVFAILCNLFISIPFYLSIVPFDAILNMCRVLYPKITEDTFYVYYLFVGILPFNLLRLGLVSTVTFLVYKRLSKILHWEIKKKEK